MFKKTIFLIILSMCTCLFSSCSLSEIPEFNYVVSNYDDETEGNSFLINREQDLKTITYLEKTNIEQLECYNKQFFKTNSLIVIKVIDNKDNPRGIKNYYFSDDNIVINLNTRLQASENKSYYFYIIKINAISADSYNRIKIYDGNTLFSNNKIYKEDYYDFLSNFDLNDRKTPFLGISDKIGDESFYGFILPKNNDYLNSSSKINLEYFDADLITSASVNYLHFQEEQTTNCIEFLFKESTKKDVLSLFEKLQKLEFVKAISEDAAIPIDDFELS